MDEFFSYDSRLYQNLLQKKFNGEELTDEEERYIARCYHWEEGSAGLL